MNKIVLFVLTGIVLFSAQSCSSVSKFEDAKQDLQDNTANPNNVLKNAKDTKAAREAKAQEKSESQQNAQLSEETEIAAGVSGLIPATNPEIRVRGNVRGRQDPFSVITVQPKLVQVQDEKAVDDVNNSKTPLEKSGSDDTTRSVVNNPPQGSSPTSEPEQPEPTLARNVIISGLIEVDGKPKLIVEAPEESSSRYVEVGQYLSNKKILVKSIDMNHSPTPLVILEQYGVEVKVPIGKKTEELSTINSDDSLSVAALTR